MQKMMVRFVKSSTPYLAGETAAFPPARAQALIATGVAAKVETKPAEAAVTGVVAPEAVEVKGDPTPFDPGTADEAALRAYLAEHGVSVHHKAGVVKLREMAAEVLGKE